MCLARRRATRVWNKALSSARYGQALYTVCKCPSDVLDMMDVIEAENYGGSREVRSLRLSLLHIYR
jgi:hypothetical protein